MTWWQGLIVGMVLGAYVTFAVSAIAFRSMRIDPVVAEWVIAAALLSAAVILFALSWT